MEINTSQVGQNFAVLKAESANGVEQTDTSVADVSSAPEAKGFSVSAEIERQDSTIDEQAKIETAVSQISEFVQANSRQLNFSIDDASNKQVVQVTDSESGEVIRQIPSEEVLELSERLQDLQTDVGAAVGLLFNKQV